MTKLNKYAIDELRRQADKLLDQAFEAASKKAFQLVDVIYSSDKVDFIFVTISDKAFQVTVTLNSKDNNIFNKDYQPIYRKFYEEKIEHDREKDED